MILLSIYELNSILSFDFSFRQEEARSETLANISNEELQRCHWIATETNMLISLTYNLLDKQELSKHLRWVTNPLESGAVERKCNSPSPRNPLLFNLLVYTTVTTELNRD